MTLTLAALILAAVALVAALGSALTGAALPALDRLAAASSPRQRARLWLLVAALPLFAASVAVGASLLPALDLAGDHCLAHDPHHPHLCPNHVSGAPGLAVLALALLAAGRALLRLATTVRDAWQGWGTARALTQASEPRHGAHVFPSDVPQAFVVGSVSPSIYASSGLFALGADVSEPVLAHERAHARHGDALWRTLFPVLATGHLPQVARAIHARLLLAQELAADEAAADALGDPCLVAEALVTLARAGSAPAAGLAFTHGDVPGRVRALLTARSPSARWPLRLLLAGCAALPLGLALSHELIHHALETVLGALG